MAKKQLPLEEIKVQLNGLELKDKLDAQKHLVQSIAEEGDKAEKIKQDAEKTIELIRNGGKKA